MRIISKFRDYYDHVAHIYGGVDPLIVYDRRNIGETRYDSTLKEDLVDNIHVDNFPGPILRTRYGSGIAYYGIVCIAGRPFYVMRNVSDNRLFIHDDTKMCDYMDDNYLYFYKRRSEILRIPAYQRPVNLHIVEISRKISHPVYMWNYAINAVEGKVPILANIGLPKLYPAEQLYQDLSYFLANVIHESPDLMPEIKRTDSERIQSHGFDVMRSFRPKMK